MGVHCRVEEEEVSHSHNNHHSSLFAASRSAVAALILTSNEDSCPSSSSGGVMPGPAPSQWVGNMVAAPPLRPQHGGEREENAEQEVRRDGEGGDERTSLTTLFQLSGMTTAASMSGERTRITSGSDSSVMNRSENHKESNNCVNDDGEGGEDADNYRKKAETQVSLSILRRHDHKVSGAAAPPPPPLANSHAMWFSGSAELSGTAAYHHSSSSSSSFYLQQQQQSCYRPVTTTTTTTVVRPSPRLASGTPFASLASVRKGVLNTNSNSSRHRQCIGGCEDACVIMSKGRPNMPTGEDGISSSDTKNDHESNASVFPKTPFTPASSSCCYKSVVFFEEEEEEEVSGGLVSASPQQHNTSTNNNIKEENPHEIKQQKQQQEQCGFLRISPPSGMHIEATMEEEEEEDHFAACLATCCPSSPFILSTPTPEEVVAMLQSSSSIKSDGDHEKKGEERLRAMRSFDSNMPSSSSAAASPMVSALMDSEAVAREVLMLEETKQRGRWRRKLNFMRVHHDNVRYYNAVLHQYIMAVAHHAGSAYNTRKEGGEEVAVAVAPPAFPRDLPFLRMLVQAGNYKIKKAMAK